MTAARTGVPLADRIMERVTPEPTTGCWLWLGAVGRGGYGNLVFDGVAIAAHRAAFWAFNGDVPAGMSVLHHCDTRSCVNPAHLWVGSQAENMADMLKKGRNRPRPVTGSRNVQSKLTEADIAPICALAPVLPQRRIASIFGVTQLVVSRIVRGLTWKHVVRPVHP